MRACSTSPASPAPMAAAGPEAASMTNPTAISRYIARNSKTSSQDRSRNKLGSRRRIATPRFLSAADAQGRPSNHAIWSRCHLDVTMGRGSSPLLDRVERYLDNYYRPVEGDRFPDALPLPVKASCYRGQSSRTSVQHGMPLGQTASRLAQAPVVCCEY